MLLINTQEGYLVKQSTEQFRIGKLALRLGVQKFVIRFWEKEFGISAHRSAGGQRFYKTKDFEKFKLIKELLYDKGFTIAGAKKLLNGQKPSSQEPLYKPSEKAPSLDTIDHLIDSLKELREQLIKLHDLL